MSISVVNRRAFTSTIESDVAGVTLNTAMNRPSSVSAFAALPGKYSPRRGGMVISSSGFSVRES